MCSGMSTSRPAMDSRKVVCEGDKTWSVAGPLPPSESAEGAPFQIRSLQEDRICATHAESVTCPFTTGECDLPLSVVERESGVLDEETSVERERVRVDVDITTLLVRGEDSVTTAVGVEAELGHAEVFLTAVGGDVGEGSSGGRSRGGSSLGGSGGGTTLEESLGGLQDANEEPS